MVVVSLLLIGLSALQTTSASYIPPPLLARDNSTTSPASATCAAPPLALQTFYPIWDAPKNAKGEDGSRLAYGPPNVPNKNRFGQPEAGSTKPKVKNVIFSVPDGFGPASQVFARNYWQWEQNKTWDDQLPADKLLIGTVRTRSSDSFGEFQKETDPVTDSAAAASAYSTGVLTYNGAIGTDDDARPIGTVLEAASAQGYLTGLVVTSRITHATPASYASHCYDREQEATIAEHMIGGTPLGHTVDLMMGGGLCYFQPNTSDYPRSCRGDQKDLLAQAKDDGYSVLTNRKQFDALDGGNNVTLPLIGLFTGSHMNYEIERNATLEPSLSEMTKTALQALKLATADSEKGFFIMVEGSKIDHAAHSHDLPGHLHEILEWNRAVQVIVDFIDEQENDDTVFIGAADHECGGLVLGGATVGGHEYQWVPEAISKSKNSAATLASRVVAYKGDDLPKFVEEEIYSAYGVFDANSTEIEGVVENLKTPGYVLEGVIADSLSRRAMCKWTTGGHSAVDVNLIAYPPHLTKDMVGNHGSTELARFVVDQLALDLNAITERLNAEDAETQDWRDTSVGTLKFVDGKPVGGALERRHHCD